MLNGSPAAEPYSVSALTALIKGTLEERYAGVWVAGELTDVKLAASGHLYFRLKDEGAVLGCAMFRPKPQRLGFAPADGLEVVARGDVSVYPPRGNYQLICDELVLRGLGELQRAFEELKARLAAEGLFAAEGKRPLPRLPKRVGVVTSRDGAALRDILRVLARRHAGLDVVLAHALVQGEGAGAELARAVEELGASGLVDVLIVGRGGGSYEDLFCFNDERLIRAIRACPVPVISAVGHEVDLSLADLAADVRAPTPSAAAEMVTAERDELRRRANTARSSLRRIAADFLKLERQRLDHFRKPLSVERLSGYLNLRRQRVDGLGERLRHASLSAVEAGRSRFARVRLALSRAHAVPRLRERALAGLVRRLGLSASGAVYSRQVRLGSGTGKLAALDPRAVIGRGYGHLTRKGAPVRSIKELRPSDELDVTVRDGTALTVVRRTFGEEADLRGGDGEAGGHRRRARGRGVPPGQTDLPL
ncbi:MAG: exodeoxyribonuclease VII large subunit [Candidatus Coatesbacteria bacterium RBG_13_66_14]|uniref:Exodeoxyribonuclease 7 large subunit n=1 Tax=Candidatus Coatesbacteria bacterium RBG_13_66_14 TaxID=1817816 RepID=A0A1F5FB23_9BACT|nr:MAG: exodeoxyribonuclease VII large subunit [Candidatus Coatesbacteria bacterium RBG_13_66_14]